MPTFWRVFIINGCWILSIAFPASIQMIIWFFFFSLLIWCIILVDLCLLKNPCIPGIDPTWSWCMILLICCCILFASILWGFLHLIHQWYWSVIFFFCSIFVWFWYQGDGGLVEWVWACSFLCNFWKSLRRMGVSSSLNVW